MGGKKKKVLGICCILLIICVIVSPFIIYDQYKKATRVITLEDLNGLWVEKTKEDRHAVLYIHDGRMEYWRYEDQEEIYHEGDLFSSEVIERFSEGSTQPISWLGELDSERSRNAWIPFREQEDEGHGWKDYREYTYKNGKIFRKEANSKTVFVRGKEEEHSHIIGITKALDRNFEASESALPLEVGKPYCYHRMGATESTYDSFLCVEITNPNPFCIEHAYVEINWTDGFGKQEVGPFKLDANSKKIYVTDMFCRGRSFREGVKTQATCAISYNRYYLIFDEESLVKIKDSQVVKDETTGLVKEILVNVDVSQPSEPSSSWGEDLYVDYDLYAVFYKNNEIVGVATGVTWWGRERPETMPYVSKISDFDRYEVYAIQFVLAGDLNRYSQIF